MRTPKVHDEARLKLAGKVAVMTGAGSGIGLRDREPFSRPKGRLSWRRPDPARLEGRPATYGRRGDEAHVEAHAAPFKSVSFASISS